MEKILDVNKVLFGGDYNPEQWDAETRNQDMIMFPEASIDTVTLNVFSWATLQPNEDTYDFSELDEIVDMVTENNFNICMATSTGAHPAWMAKKYPEILRTDFEGRAHKFGNRHNSCPNSPVFRKYSKTLASRLAKHYKDQKNIVIWHISNEYGGECYCDNCAKAFRVWLKNKYKTLDKLNYEWNTKFWSHTFYDWDEIELPNTLTEYCFGATRSSQPGIALDYKRFNSDSMMQNMVDEIEAIREYIPNAKFTTNFMMTFKTLDYKRWAKYMDVISWDSYPQMYTAPSYIAFNNDLMRGLKGGQPFMLMEQASTVSAWLPANTMKRPGVMRQLSYQAMAHGADTVMFFQMRKSVASCEMYHGAIIDHSGRNDTRSFKEVVGLGKELKKLGDITLGARTDAKVAIVFDWDNWWTIEDASGLPHALSYPDEIIKYYKALYDLNIPVDIVGTEDELGKYDVVFAPLLHLIKDDIDIKLIDFANNGGTVLLNIFSGYVTENDRAILGGYPGPYKALTGNWVEETSMLLDEESVPFTYGGNTYDGIICTNVIHNENSESLGEFKDDYVEGMSAVTVNNYGKGKCYYVGTSVADNSNFIKVLVRDIASEKGLCDALGQVISADADVTVLRPEITKRTNDKGSIYYIMNPYKEEVEFELPFDGVDLISDAILNKNETIKMSKYDVKLVAEKR